MTCRPFIELYIFQSGWTPLIIASSAGRLKVVELLLAKGVDVDACAAGGHGALQYAASRNRDDVLQRALRLLNAPANC